MRWDALFALLVVTLGGVGTWLLLPHRHNRARPHQAHLIGGALAGAAGLMLALFWSPPSGFLTSAFFYAFALMSLAGGVLMITSKSPVHSALWFATVVLATSGLFLLAGAQFLAAGTVIVYAGAIIVTFLFVLMLAQVGGEAAYDRTARVPARATLCCFVLLWSVLYCLLATQRPEGPALDEAAQARRLVPQPGLAIELGPALGPNPARTVMDLAVRPETARLPQRPGLPGQPPPHVAGLGGTLFTDHLIAVEVIGAVLFVALVGAALIAAPRPPVRPRAQSN